MQRVTSAIRRLMLPQLVVGIGALLAFFGGLAVSSAPERSPRTFAVHRPAAPHVMHVSTVAPVDCTKVACFGLTFDDGPDGTVTPQILDILKRHNVRATFFVLGSHIAGHEELLRRIHSEGHEIGNHSWSHASFTKIPLEQVESEVQGTQAAVAAAGVPAPQLFRPPYGDMNDAVLAHVPLTVIRWNVDPEDWHPKKYQHALEHMAAHAKPGGMAVLHDTELHTAEMLDQLLNQLKDQQYTMVTVSELLDLPAGQHGVFYGR
jgi:peptidoglycan/xylan/chitin deacetylase (PgdA/CDA1 family)